MWFAWLVKRYYGTRRKWAERKHSRLCVKCFLLLDRTAVAMLFLKNMTCRRHCALPNRETLKDTKADQGAP